MNITELISAWTDVEVPTSRVVVALQIVAAVVLLAGVISVITGFNSSESAGVVEIAFGVEEVAFALLLIAAGIVVCRLLSIDAHIRAMYKRQLKQQKEA